MFTFVMNFIEILSATKYSFDDFFLIAFFYYNTNHQSVFFSKESRFRSIKSIFVTVILIKVIACMFEFSKRNQSP